MSSTSTAVPHDTTNPPSNSSPPPKNPSPRSPSLNLGATQSLGKAPTTSSSMQNLRSSVSLGGSSKPSPSAGGKIRTAGLSQQNLPATFAATLKENCPPLPPQLLRKLSTKDTATSVGKVKVLLKVFQGGEVPGSSRVLSVDNRRRCVTLYDPATPSSAIPTTVTPTKIIECAAITPSSNITNNPTLTPSNILENTPLPSSQISSTSAVEDSSVDEGNLKRNLASESVQVNPVESVSNEEMNTKSDIGPKILNTTESEETKSLNFLNSSGPPVSVSEGKGKDHPANGSSLDGGSVPKNGLRPKEDHLCSATIKGVSAPKMFSFDGVYTHDDSQTELCSSSLSDVIIAALRGAQGAVFTFGQPHLGERDTMIGCPRSPHTLGILPASLCWLYRAMQESTDKDGSFSWSATVSALQILPSDKVMDLLTPTTTISEPSLVSGLRTTAILRDSPETSVESPSHSEVVPQTLLSKASKVPAPTLTRAAQLLDLALASRHADEWGRPAHLVFSLNLYRHNDKNGSQGPTSSGCWGRLHLLDLGPVDKSSRTSSSGRAVTLSSLGNTILAIINGHKQPPQKEGQLGVLGRLLRECLGSLRCVTSMIVHVSAEPHRYQDTLATVQLAARVHRLRRRRIKPQIGGSGSGGSSEESKSGRSSRGTITDTGSSSMDPSSSELSCDTVIYVGPGADDATDSEHPPVFLPSTSSPDNRCSIRKALRGSIVDTTKLQDSPRIPRKMTSKRSPKHNSASKETTSPSRTKDKSKNPDKPETRDLSRDDGQENVPSPLHINSKSPCRHCAQGNRVTSSPKYKQCSHGCRHRKVSIGENQILAPQGPSDEQWVDGPRFHKSKVLESQKIKGYELETWIDGPEATYGYMDDVKKSMVQKWVETQNSQSHLKESSNKSPKHTKYKEMTQFKTSEVEEHSPKHKEKHKEKRKSAECKELRKEKHSSHAKDSSHRRRSANDVAQKQTNSIDNSNSKKLSNNTNSTQNQVPKDSTSHSSRKDTLKNGELKDPPVEEMTDLPKKEEILSLPKVIANQVSPKDSITQDDEEENKVDNSQKVLPQPINQSINTQEESQPKQIGLPESAVEETSQPSKLVKENPDEDVASEISMDNNALSQEDESFSVLSNDDFTLDEELPEDQVYLRQVGGEGQTWEEYEFIEVEEPLEPVELVDSWTQVTEEDLLVTQAAYSLMTPRRMLPPVQEEAEPNTDSLEDESEEGRELESFHNEVSCDSSVAENADEQEANHSTQLDDHLCEVDIPVASRFEEMIHDPNFMAKTHYFAQRLEELRKLHQFYKNLAKQAPRRNSTLIHSPSSGMLPDLLMMPLEDVERTEDPGTTDPFLLPQPVFSTEGTLSSLKIENEYNFDWKSLLPEEIEVGSDCGEAKLEGDDSASDFSKDVSEAVYDIQSDIMPYLPSNYVSLSSLSASRPPDLIMTSNISCDELLQPPKEEETRKPSPIAEHPVTESSTTNILSLSDDETNVKNIKVKKEKKKKKMGIISGTGKKNTKESEAESNSGFGKMSWSRFFGSPKKSSSQKESPKKGSKTPSKFGGKTQSSSSKSSDRKSKDRCCRDDQRTISSREPRIHGDVEIPRLKTQHKNDSEKSRSKSSTRKLSNDYRTSGSNSSSYGRSSKKESSRESSHKNSKQDLSGRSRNTFQRESLGGHPSNTSTTSSIIYPGYDSGADSGVGLRVTSSRNSRRSQGGSMPGVGDCRHGESSGYESVLRDSECSSFGSSQDSGLDDDPTTAKKKDGPKHQANPVNSQSSTHQIMKSSTESLPVPTDGAYHAGIDVCESVNFEAVALPPPRPEIAELSEEEVYRYENRRLADKEIPTSSNRVPTNLQLHDEKIEHLRETQSRLKQELEAAKERLMIDKSRWSYELHVESAMSTHEEGFLEALEAETCILQKRVCAAASRCLLESSFLSKGGKIGGPSSLSSYSDGAPLFNCSCLQKEIPTYCSGFPKNVFPKDGAKVPVGEDDTATSIQNIPKNESLEKPKDQSPSIFRRRKKNSFNGAGDSVRLSGIQL